MFAREDAVVADLNEENAYCVGQLDLRAGGAPTGSEKLIQDLVERHQRKASERQWWRWGGFIQNRSMGSSFRSKGGLIPLTHAVC
jgi:hypothetical protein